MTNNSVLIHPEMWYLLFCGRVSNIAGINEINGVKQSARRREHHHSKLGDNEVGTLTWRFVSKVAWPPSEPSLEQNTIIKMKEDQNHSPL